MVRVAAIGECMVELRHTGATTLTLGAAGDTFNAAVYLAREAAPDLDVHYVTVLGTDPYSDELLDAMRAEGLDITLVERVPDRLPGAYFVRTDEGGERSFFYYRSAAAARLLFSTPGADTLADALAGFDLLYFSGITLAVLDDVARGRLLDTVVRTRARGGRVAFDTNYRPVLWPDASSAVAAIEPFLAHTDFALPSADDEAALRGLTDPGEMIAALHERGVPEVLLTRGSEGAIASRGGDRWEIPAQVPREVVDTTAAGDAFNGAYLAARLRGAGPADAARGAARLSAEVVSHPGAIAPRPSPSPAPPSGPCPTPTG